MRNEKRKALAAKDGRARITSSAVLGDRSRHVYGERSASAIRTKDPTLAATSDAVPITHQAGHQLVQLQVLLQARPREKTRAEFGRGSPALQAAQAAPGPAPGARARAGCTLGGTGQGVARRARCGRDAQKVNLVGFLNRDRYAPARALELTSEGGKGGKRSPSTSPARWCV